MTAPSDRPSDEQAFLASYDPDAFERPSVTVDVALLTVADRAPHALLVRRGEHPDRGRFALPGGFVGVEEDLEAAATRVLERETGLRDVFIEQLYTFGDLDRDPRTRVITVAYYALVPAARLRAAVTPDGDARLARLVVPWAGEAGGEVEAVEAGSGARLPLAFDHAAILGMAVKRLRGKLDYAPIGYQLLPERFTLRQLQDVHESVLGRRLNKGSFRRRMLASGELRATGELEAGVGHRPAELYRFQRRSAV